MISIKKCFGCFHEWASKKDRPKRCPKCRDYNWDDELGTKKKPGRKSKNGIADLVVGQEIFLPFHHWTDKNGRIWPDEEKNLAYTRAVNHQIRKYNKTFFTRSVARGLFVKRLT